MKCQLIQTTKIADENTGERQMLAWLKNLPEDYYVYRELQITETLERRMQGYEKKKPDFVVVSPAVGLVSIEVKHWNLEQNTYQWQDQYKIVKRDHDGSETKIDNPTALAEAYRNALMALLSDIGVFVTSIVAFPTVSRAGFLNKLENVHVLRNPQTRFYLDLDTTLFRDDLDEFAARPEALLQRIAQRHAKFYQTSARGIERVHERLMPSSFRIGDFTDRQRHRNALRVLSEEQQTWVFRLDKGKNYLLDVAGSGKTNVLISRAIHTVKQAGRAVPPRVLLTTYSRNLETNIKRIFEHKIVDDPEGTYLRDAIAVHCVPALMELIVMRCYGLTSIASYQVADESPEAYEGRLRADVRDILVAEPDAFRAYDHVFIDEIQDFDNLFLQVMAHLCRSRSFFFVGDIGQKIYEREHDLARLGFLTEHVELKKSYKMYRTPRYIAELATTFILGDPGCKQEFSEHGYTEAFKYPNKLAHVAELSRSPHPIQEVVARVKDLLAGPWSLENIMIITSQDRLPEMEQAVTASGIRCSVGETEQEPALTLVDFMDVKGLEKEMVFVFGIEDLYHRSCPAAMFDSEDDRRRKERLSRRKVYVALTRSLEELIIYYQDPQNRFVAELLSINRDVLKRVQGAGHGS